MPAAAVDGVTVTFEVAWGKGVGDTVSGGDWTDESAYVESFTTRRGRSTELDQFQAGTLTVRLNNRTRRFDPDYTSGALYGNLKPGRPCRLRYTRSAVTYDVFYGFIDSLPQEWDPPRNAFATIVAFDALAVLALAPLPQSRYVAEVLADSPLAWWRLGEQEGTQALDSSGNNRNGIYVNGPTFNTRDGLVAFDQDNSIEFDAASRQYMDPRVTFATLGGSSWSVEFWFSSSATTETTRSIIGAALANATVYFYVTVPDSGGAAGKFQVRMVSPGASSSCQSSSNAATGTTKHVVVATRNGAAPAIYVNGTDETTSPAAVSGVSFTNLPELLIGALRNSGGYYLTGTLDDVAIYSGDIGATRALAHYNAGTTANAGDDVDAQLTQALTDAGITWLATSFDDSQITAQAMNYQGGNLLAFLQKLERTEQGRLFVSAAGTLTFHSRYHDATTTSEISFTDVQPSSYPYTDLGYAFDRTRVYNTATVTRDNGEPRSYTDATSTTANGPRTLGVDGVLMQSDEEAYDLAVALVGRYKDPAQRYERIGVNMRSAPATLYAAIGTLELGDKVSAARTPQSLGNATNRTLTVEGIAHTFDKKSSTWVVELLTAAANLPAYLTLDSASLGQLDEELVGY